MPGDPPSKWFAYSTKNVKPSDQALTPPGQIDSLFRHRAVRLKARAAALVESAGKAAEKAVVSLSQNVF
ncbi:hypothetical protein [Bacillus tequilensis]|uniref:hypothetical protein n=1 Tax=Bacillus tequilensis TaxID=227866 RepID=UPI001F0DFA69|nr:hypothetical protein [Bacillus tequilensis]